MYNFRTDKIIIWDTEYTSWEWSLDTKWSRNNEFREVVEIWAIKVDTKTFEILDIFHVFVNPIINHTLSDYFMNLTWIKQKIIDSKWRDFWIVLKDFEKWSEWLDAYSFWNDELVIAENCWLNKISFPFRWNMFRNARDIFKSFWIDAYKFNSWTIHKAVWIESNEKEHTALGDAKNIVNSMRKLYIW